MRIPTLMTMLALVAAGPAATEETLTEPLDCVNLSQLDRTAVVNDQMILFYMKNKEVYLNHLPQDCPTLRAYNRFMYRVTMNRLCDMDQITVLHDSGFGFYEGPSCGLGKFEPISPVYAKKILKSGGL